MKKRSLKLKRYYDEILKKMISTSFENRSLLTQTNFKHLEQNKMLNYFILNLQKENF